jgi:hypothetical protein
MRVALNVELVVACVALPLALELFPASSLLRAIERVPRRRGPPADPERLAIRVDALLGRMPFIWKWTCLRRVVVLATLLRRDGREASVVIGVRRVPTPERGTAAVQERGSGSGPVASPPPRVSGPLQAHAWLRCDGVEPYLEPPGSDPSTFRRLERASDGATPPAGTREARG